MLLALDPRQWAEQQFGGCALGDARRTRRLVQFAAQVAADPDASTPAQTERWSDLKAAYRLIDNAAVTFEAVAGPHWEQTRSRDAGTWLISCDTTEVQFGPNNQATGLGPLGTGVGRGFLLHSGLLLDPATEAVIGLAGQKIRYRRAAPKNEKRTARIQRDRESLIWGELIEQIGRPPAGNRFVNLCDRGADNFEVYCRLLQQGHDWVVRVAKPTRIIQHEGQQIPLHKHLATLPLAGTYELTYRDKNLGQRTARVEVRASTVGLPAPQLKSPWLRAQGIALNAMNVVEVREVNAPAGVAPLHWVLFTSLPISTFGEIWLVIEYYEKRPIVEEFHKAFKTGCRVEDRQYETSARLEAIAALLSVTAVRLLQLRSAARETPEQAAEQTVPRRWISVLRSLRPGRAIRTVRQFYRELAGLGGHLLRKGDGEPGWITLWRGFEKLHLALRAIRNYEQQCG